MAGAGDLRISTTGILIRCIILGVILAKSPLWVIFQISASDANNRRTRRREDQMQNIANSWNIVRNHHHRTFDPGTGGQRWRRLLFIGAVRLSTMLIALVDDIHRIKRLSRRRSLAE